MQAKLSLVERAVLEALARCKTPQMRCLIKKARHLFPRWGLNKNDIIWGIKRLRKSGMLTGRYGKRGQAAIFYRMANNRKRRRNAYSATRRKAKILHGPSPRQARRLLQRYYRRRNPLRRKYYAIRFQKLTWREAKRRKRQERKHRLAKLQARKRGRK